MTEQKYPEPICGALIFNPADKIFLMKSHKWKDKYVIPGGHIELGERIEDALKREIKEETGLDIHDIEFICFQEFVYGEEFWKKKHFIFFDFFCKTNSSGNFNFFFNENNTNFRSRELSFVLDVYV